MEKGEKVQIKRGLGRGLESLLPQKPLNVPPSKVETSATLHKTEPISPIETAEKSTSQKVRIEQIVPNRLQPRTVFDEEKIRELSNSIKEQGLIQPLIVTQSGNNRYELIAGERRLRACRLAGMEEVPVVIKDVDDEGLLALSIIENIQREDLNPIEEANAYQELMNQFEYTQEDVAKKVGKSRVAVANSLRLLNLPRVIQDDVAGGRYSAGHARAILSLTNLHDQLKIREQIIRDVATVRDVEKMVQSYIGGARKIAVRKTVLSPQIGAVVETMKRILGTKVAIEPKGVGGKLIIEYYSSQSLDLIVRKLTS